MIFKDYFERQGGTPRRMPSTAYPFSGQRKSRPTINQAAFVRFVKNQISKITT
jgi:hypothetical protein